MKRLLTVISIVTVCTAGANHRSDFRSINSELTVSGNYSQSGLARSLTEEDFLGTVSQEDDVPGYFKAKASFHQRDQKRGFVCKFINRTAKAIKVTANALQKICGKIANFFSFF